MLMQILRTILAIIDIVILIPFRILLILYVIAGAIYDRVVGYFTFKESWEIICEGVKEAWEKNIYWIKTGKVQ